MSIMIIAIVKKMNFFIFKELAIELGIDLYALKFYYRVPSARTDQGLHEILDDETRCSLITYPLILVE